MPWRVLRGALGGLPRVVELSACPLGCVYVLCCLPAPRGSWAALRLTPSSTHLYHGRVSHNCIPKPHMHENNPIIGAIAAQREGEP